MNLKVKQTKTASVLPVRVAKILMEMKYGNENKSVNEKASENEAGSDTYSRNARNKSQNKTSQSYNSEGASSRY